VAGDAASRLDGEEKQMALVLRTALLSTVMLSRFPKAIVEVHVCVLQSDGGGLTWPGHCVVRVLSGMLCVNVGSVFSLGLSNATVLPLHRDDFLAHRGLCCPYRTLDRPSLPSMRIAWVKVLGLSPPPPSRTLPRTSRHSLPPFAAALAACLTVASLALADAGVDCLDLLPAVTVVTHVPASPPGAAPVLLLDPCEAEERGAGAATTVALMPSSGLLA
jgi:hypothetical protein